MFKTIRGLSLALALGMTAICGTAHAADDSLEKIRERGEILIGVDTGQAPFGIVDSSMQPTGSDVEAARLLAQDLGVKLKIVPVTPANRIPILSTRKVNAVMASFSITEERKRVVNFSEPYSMIQAAVFAPADMKVERIEDLANKAIAVARGSTNDILITEQTKNVPGVSIMRYDDNATSLTAVATGQQEVYVAAPSLMAELNKLKPVKTLEEKLVLKTFPIGVGLNKNDEALKVWIDQWVKTNMANGRLNDIYKKFHGASLPDEWLAQK